MQYRRLFMEECVCVQAPGTTITNHNGDGWRELGFDYDATTTRTQADNKYTALVS